MAFLKAQWRWIAFGGVCLASLGAGGLAVWASSDIEKRLVDVDELVSRLPSYQRNAVNLKIIGAKKAEIEAKRTDFDETMNAALAMQKHNPFHERTGPDGKPEPVLRQTVRPNVLPEPERAAAFSFIRAYATEFEELRRRLRARDKPTLEEVEHEQIQLRSLRGEEDDKTTGAGAWGPSADTASSTENKPPQKELSLSELLRERPESRAAEKVANSIYMYLDDGAITRHPLVDRNDAPPVVEIWHAQMTLWIQQDIVAALARMNEQRAGELTEADQHEGRLWVAYMPVKRLMALSIAGVLGKGGASGPSTTFAGSFTGVKNDEKRFVVPIQLRLIVEESAVPKVLESICRIGFYTPISATYVAVMPDPFSQEYVYGDAPVVSLTLDLEGYYFRKVFDEWIPKELKQILATPEAVDETEGARRR